MKVAIRIKVNAVPHQEYSRERMVDFINKRFGDRKYKLEQHPDIKENKIQFVFEMRDVKQDDFIMEIRDITEAFQQIGSLNMYEVTSCSSEFIK